MKKLKEQVKASAVEQLDEIIKYDDNQVYGCDLHNQLFNQDYWVIGRYQAGQDLAEYGTFKAIDKIKEYEQDNFGEVITDLSEPEKVLNMLVYILGEELLSKSDTLRDNWDTYLTVEQMQNIINEL